MNMYGIYFCKTLFSVFLYFLHNDTKNRFSHQMAILVTPLFYKFIDYTEKNKRVNNYKFNSFQRKHINRYANTE